MRSTFGYSPLNCSSYVQIRRELDGAQADIAQSSSRIDRADARAGELGAELATKASLQALRECVTRRHYEQAVSALGAAVEQKAAQHSLDNVQSKLQVIACMQGFILITRLTLYVCGRDILLRNM